MIRGSRGHDYGWSSSLRGGGSPGTGLVPTELNLMEEVYTHLYETHTVFY